MTIGANAMVGRDANGLDRLIYGQLTIIYFSYFQTYWSFYRSWAGWVLASWVGPLYIFTMPQQWRPGII